MRAPRGLHVVTSGSWLPTSPSCCSHRTCCPPVARDVVLGNIAFVGAICLLVRAGRVPPGRAGLDPRAGRRHHGVPGRQPRLHGPGQPPRAPSSFPSIADVGYLVAYPFLVTGLLLALRENLRRMRLIVALDGLSGTLAGASVATWAIAPLISRVWDGSLTAAITLAYPTCAVVAIAVTLGAVGMVGPRQGTRLPGVGRRDAGVRRRRHHLRLPAGLRRLPRRHLAGRALARRHGPGGRGCHQPADRGARSLPGARSLIVVAVAAISTVVVLAMAPPWRDNPAPTVLALLALLACAVRLVLAFLQLRELAAVRELALTDELTGAANRRALYSALDAMFVREATTGATPSGFALALIDLDHFKEVNDSFGHAAGDELLQAVVSRFAARARGPPDAAPAGPARGRRVRGDPARGGVLQRRDGLRQRTAGEPRRADRAARRGAARAGQHRGGDGADARSQPRRHAVRRGRRDVRGEDVGRGDLLPLAGRGRGPAQAAARRRGPLPRARAARADRGVPADRHRRGRPRRQPRRWCAGTTPSGAGSRRRSSWRPPSATS